MKRRTVLLGNVAFCVIVGSCDTSRDTSPLPRWSLVADARIGDDESGPAFELSTIRFLTARPDTVYVVHGDGQEIRAFDARGAHVRTIGRAGAGPGEFDAIWSLGFVADTLWAIDPHLRRLSLFTATGDLLATIPFSNIGSAEQAASLPYPTALMSARSLLGVGGWSGTAIAEGRQRAIPILRLTPDETAIDTLAWVSIERRDLILQSATTRMFRDQPFSDAPLAVFAPRSERVYVVDRTAATEAAGASFHVTAVRANGDTLWSHRHPYDPAPLDDQAIDSVRLPMEASLKARFPPSEVRRALYTPRFWTPIRDAVAGVDGTLWLQWTHDTKPDAYSVIDADGRRIADVAVPPRARVHWVSDSIVWGVELDDDDVPIVTRYRVIRDVRSRP